MDPVEALDAAKIGFERCRIESGALLPEFVCRAGLRLHYGEQVAVGKIVITRNREGHCFIMNAGIKLIQRCGACAKVRNRKHNYDQKEAYEHL
jgi:hypothetical protein